MKKIFILFLIITAYATINAQSKYVEAGEKFKSLLQLIEYTYVDSADIDKLTEKAIIEVLKELDPHSVYISKKDLKAMNEPLEGSFEGIGIQFNILNDTITVVEPIVGGPSESVGIKAGDKIVTIDGENVGGIGIDNNGVAKRLRGKKGTKVNVEIKRRGVKELLDFTITRDKIPIFSVDAVYMATPKTGYIKVSRFARNTIEEFRKGLLELKAKKAQNLIIDLRGNGGGYLQTAIQMVDEILEDNKLIVYTEGLHQHKQEYYTTTKGLFENGKIAILVDEGSASASEIVSGAVQDYDRGVIIGRRTFGKGLVQKPMPLYDGSYVRLTTARYHTPSGRCIQRSYKNGKDNYYKDIIKRYDSGEVYSKDSIHFPDSLKYKTLVSKRIVYGGGGIMPDIFIPLDTSYNTPSYGKILRKGLVNEFSLNYMDNHRDVLNNRFSNFDEFNENFDVEKEVLPEFLKFVEEQEIAFPENELNKSKPIILLQLKGLVARNLWGISYYFQVINTMNNAYLKAIEVLESNKLKELKIVNYKE